MTHIQDLLVRCPEVTVEFLPAVVGALPLSMYQASDSSGAAAAAAIASSPTSEAVTRGKNDATGGVNSVLVTDQEEVLNLLRFLQAQTEKHSYPASLLEG